MASNVAYHFAISLLRSARKTGEIEKTREDLGTIVKLMATERRVVYFLLHPLVPLAKKKEFLEAVCGTDIVRRMMKILLETKHLSLVGEVHAQFSEMARRELGVVKAMVRTAAELSREDEERLRAAIAGLTGKQVQMEVAADPALLGGVWMRIGDKVIDNTVKTELKMARARLVSS
jgi:F-type H+-transporting ATPase subunit delta